MSLLFALRDSKRRSAKLKDLPREVASVCPPLKSEGKQKFTAFMGAVLHRDRYICRGLIEGGADRI